MRALITGRSGSGKSTLCRELQALGQPAYDGDRIPDLADWVDAETGEIISMDYTKPIDRTRHKWNWDTIVLDSFLHAHPTMFLCGSADNDIPCFDRFDRVFVLDVPPEIQRARITGRTEHDYGKQPGMTDIILAEQQEFVQAAVRAGALVLDATQTPAVLARTILERC